LPVRKWEISSVNVKQDPSAEPGGDQPNQSQTDGFNTESYPWPEQPLPTFFHQLAPHNQALIRLARTGNLNAKPSVWDSKSESWISSSEAEARTTQFKSRHLQNLDAVSPAADGEDENEDNDDHFVDEDEDGRPRKRKQLTSLERTFNATKWNQVPYPQADKMEDKKYLADRRPGMRPLYGANTILPLVSGYGTTSGANAIAGVDSGDGGGLGNAPGVLGAPPVQTPRKNIPPRRKKKKPGGPGRKKANPDPVTITTPMEGVQLDGTAERPEAQDKTIEDGTKEEGEDGTGSESEGDVSEEGEIDEGNVKDQKPEEVIITEDKITPALKPELVEAQRVGETEKNDLLDALELGMQENEP